MLNKSHRNLWVNAEMSSLASRVNLNYSFRSYSMSTPTATESIRNTEMFVTASTLEQALLITIG